jgi:hypothetical protein
MTNIRQQAVVSLTIVVLSAVAAGATPPALPAVLLQYGVGTQLYAITSEGLVGQVTTKTGLKQGEWFSIEKGAWCRESATLVRLPSHTSKAWEKN